jgi:hypothetical protein
VYVYVYFRKYHTVHVGLGPYNKIDILTTLSSYHSLKLYVYTLLYVYCTAVHVQKIDTVGLQDCYPVPV